jgi:hypothetical protein
MVLVCDVSISISAMAQAYFYAVENEGEFGYRRIMVSRGCNNRNCGLSLRHNALFFENHGI